MPSFLIFLITTLLICLVYLVYKLYRYKTQKYLSAWIITRNTSTHRYFELYEYIHNAQINLNLPKEFRICGDYEWLTTKEILSKFQEEFSEMYFTDKVFFPSNISKLSGEVFFMEKLNAYLDSNITKSQFLGYDMHENLICQNGSFEYGDFTYKISNFATVFFKLCYITSAYFENKEEMENIANIINSNQITIFSYR